MDFSSFKHTQKKKDCERELTNEASPTDQKCLRSQHSRLDGCLRLDGATGDGRWHLRFGRGSEVGAGGLNELKPQLIDSRERTVWTNWTKFDVWRVIGQKSSVWPACDLAPGTDEAVL